MIVPSCVLSLVIASVTFAKDPSDGVSELKAANMSAAEILSKGISALGGEPALEALKGISSHAYLYRSQTLMESFTPQFPDQTIATVGTQTISYDLSGGPDSIIQRIDKDYSLGEFWYFGRPQLDAVNVSIVTRNNPSNGYSCYVSGSENIYLPPQATLGYADPAFANILLRDAARLYPKLLLGFKATPVLQASTLVSHGVSYPALTDAYLNITVAFDSKTFLPHIIRAYEDHHIFGNSTSDFIVYNYTAVAGVQIPRRIKLMYNEDNLLVDALIGDIEANPKFSQGYFDGLPQSAISQTALQIPPSPAAASAEFGDAEVFEFASNLLWFGGYLGNIKNVTVTYPIPELKGLIHLIFNDAPGYSTTIASTEDAVMVTDSPPHQSKLVIQWIKENLHRSPTHLLITHHHHDHNYGAADYVAAGAKLVVPKDHAYYWKSIPNVQFSTVTTEKPFIYKSKSMQVRAIYPGIKDVHAADWMYFTFSAACPTSAANSTVAVEIADAWSPGAVGYEFDQKLATQWLAIARRDKLVKDHLVIPIHGAPTPASLLYEETGYDFPDYKIEDFIPGGPWCDN